MHFANMQQQLEKKCEKTSVTVSQHTALRKINEVQQQAT